MARAVNTKDIGARESACPAPRQRTGGAKVIRSAVRMIRFVIGALLATEGVAASRAAADPLREEATPPADAQRQRGLRALAEGNADIAVDAFTRALAQEESDIAWLNLGMAQVRRGQPQAALLAFEAYLARAPADSAAAQRRAVDEELRRLRATSTNLWLDVSPPAEEVLLDGQPTLPSDHILLLDPGRHHVELRAAGHRPHRQRLELPAGRFRLKVTLQPERSGDINDPRGETLGTTLGEPGLPTPPGSADGHASTPVSRRTPPPSVNKAPCALSGHCIEATVAVGIPNAIGLAAAVRLHPYLDAMIGVQWLPRLTVQGTRVGADLWTAGVRAHPFQDPWFLGVGFGIQRIYARRDHPAATATARMALPVLTLGAGYIARNGLALGMDAQVMFEIGRQRLNIAQSTNPDQAELQVRLEQEVKDGIDRIRHLLPVMFQLNLVRVGYFF